jgi:hypothetical protein
MAQPIAPVLLIGGEERRLPPRRARNPAWRNADDSPCAYFPTMRLVGNAPSLLTRQVPGVFHSRSNPAPNTFPNGRNEIEIGRFQGLKT